MLKRPNSMRHLDDAIRRLCGNSSDDYVRTRTIMANAIVANMLPDGVVKGGAAIKMRFGDAATRFTSDLDTATISDPADYAARLNNSLSRGWEGFGGRVIPKEPASPQGVASEYVMQPFDVKLTYMGKPWCTVPLEVGHNEIGDADVADWVELPDVALLFKMAGLPTPGSVPLMRLEYQVAQKLHAVTGNGDRPRDLIDLQLIMDGAEVDLVAARRTCERLFAYRKKQGWPATVVKKSGWDELYAEQASGLPVLERVDDAIKWANDLVRSICEAS